MRWIVIGVLVLVAIVVAWVLLHPSNVGDRTKLDREFSSDEQHRIDTVAITAGELAEATCTDGAQCWVAVDGVVYDLGSVPTWQGGTHHGVSAGTDATEAFVRSGHGRQILEHLPVVGRYQP